LPATGRSGELPDSSLPRLPHEVTTTKDQREEKSTQRILQLFARSLCPVTGIYVIAMKNNIIIFTPQDDVEEEKESDRKEALELAIRKLPDAQRVPLVLFHFQEMSYEEIATKLQISLAKANPIYIGVGKH
jgi:RNA polymerase sigma factor (sigma-70 family)